MSSNSGSISIAILILHELKIRLNPPHAHDRLFIRNMYVTTSTSSKFGSFRCNFQTVKIYLQCLLHMVNMTF